ncbi:hypothetical protein BKA64DRAFT_683724, partial [Cadophora sp. MPI-SDFR-AT-0126]
TPSTPPPPPPSQNIRTFYLSPPQNQNLPPPLLSTSAFVPRPLITHLMRNKRPSALGAKYVSGSEITNMEGAMHTFVVPVVPRCETAGDYCYSYGHRVTPPVIAQTEEGKKVMMTRSVVMSASIHMDFELSTVMTELCRLRGDEVVGRDLGDDPDWRILSKEEKQDSELREDYDEALRQHMVFHLMSSRRLPAVSDPRNKVLSHENAISFLSSLISTTNSNSNSESMDIPTKLINQNVKINSRILSLELLFATAFHLVRNEFSALEALCPQGYVYTYDPASIFAGHVGATLLNRLFILAIKYLSSHNQLVNLRIFGFNNYADRAALELTKVAFGNQADVIVVSKSELFQAEDGRFVDGVWVEGKGKGDGGRYDVSRWPSAKGAMLVIHNNSDAFGQNVETEGMSGSLDGAIGASSSAAGSLMRGREDLVKWIV